MDIAAIATLKYSISMDIPWFQMVRKRILNKT